MNKRKNSIDHLLASLHERAKELNCIYGIEEILSDLNTPLEDACHKIIKAIPPGWQYPDICKAKIEIEDLVYTADNVPESEWSQKSKITANDIEIGAITVFYTKEMPVIDDGPFLKEETKLINTIAERLGHFIVHQKMTNIVHDWELSKAKGSENQGQWNIVLEMLKQTDRNLYLSISRKMLNHLCWSGIKEAEDFLKVYNPESILNDTDLPETWNQPLEKQRINVPKGFCDDVFRIASDYLNDDEILKLIKRWVQQDKLSFLVQVVNRNLSLAEVSDAIRRYYHLADGKHDVRSSNEIGIVVSLIRRFLSGQLQYINVIKNFINIRDFYYLLKNVIFSADSHGRLGGKSAGLYLAAQILKKNQKNNDLLKNIHIPKTWHITSDVLLHFMHYNDFEEVVEQKYKEINQVRLEYPHIVGTFKRGHFPPDIIQGVSLALDDLGDQPLIVRSSSLLEDRVGAAFSGKYKSLFLANTGSKKDRLSALLDAIAEVYASTFSPDPIEYRAERGLLDFGEEMGIIIQEVVGKRVGKYFMPAFAGVAFSKNEFRWSPRINRDDGLLRLVPGLGTRAVDRLSDDYPVLVAPGQPNLKVNVEPDEIYKYSPKQIDVINLENSRFETIDLKKFLIDVGYDLPAINKMASVYKAGHIRKGVGLQTDFEKDEVVINFEGLFKDTNFLAQMNTILHTLEDNYGHAIDLEFAHDGDKLYLLQCRSLSHLEKNLPAPIPKDISHEKIIFTANKYISNGRVPDVTHLVYVNPDSYSQLPDRRTMLEVGRAIGHLNKILPKRQFVLMGPGRWGSRGDIKLGVSVTYSDINNSSVLIEVARKKGNYIPDLSFGTHFFQDLVESEIRYLPLYPDDDNVIFNEIFLRKSDNILSQVLPEYAYLEDTIKLIDIPQTTNGKILKILLNADLEEGVGFLDDPLKDIDSRLTAKTQYVSNVDEFWQWRYKMAERIAGDLSEKDFGVRAFYILGSTKNATAGPGSDIDLLVHFRGTDRQQELLIEWFDGWSKCLAEMNYSQTGYSSEGLLDVHIITDEDIANRSSYASKIGAVTDAAKELPLVKKSD